MGNKITDEFADWLSKPGSMWRNTALMFLAIIILMSLIPAIEERRPIAAFAETFVAWLFYLASSLGALAAGVAVGIKVGHKSTIAGWIVGIVVCLITGLGARFLADEIPGVGWRLERISTSDNY